jgi:hypothetical protein
VKFDSPIQCSQNGLEQRSVSVIDARRRRSRGHRFHQSYSGSFDSRREVAIEIHDDHNLERLGEVVHKGWENSQAIDLTDNGMFCDLKDCEGAERLATKSSL